MRWLILLYSWVAVSQTPGAFHENMVCVGDTTQSYALYLPSQYTGDRSWPILICLDPASRGKIPVKGFQEAAERWGYIVIGSNNSHNYNWSSTTKAVNAMTHDAFSRFNIDQRRIYHAGFSGGARASCDLALMARKAAGVIAFGAAFNRARQPDALNRFDFVGVIGSHDMNYYELILLDKRLDDLRWNHQILVFDGGHHWPEARHFTRALFWMELAAHQKGLIENADALEGLYQYARNEAKTFEDHGQYYEAYRDYERLIQGFRSLRSLKELKQEHKRLANLEAVRETHKRKEAIARKETRLLRTYHGEIDNLRFDELTEKTLKKAHAFWLEKAAELKELPSDPEEALLVKRLRETMENGIWEVAMVALSKQDYTRASQTAEISVTLSPQNIGSWLTLSQACARNVQHERSRQALEKAIELGFNRPKMLETQPHWESVRQTPWFQAAITGLNQTP